MLNESISAWDAKINDGGNKDSSFILSLEDGYNSIR
jgi:hypothetical protein